MAPLLSHPVYTELLWMGLNQYVTESCHISLSASSITVMGDHCWLRTSDGRFDDSDL